MREVEPAEFNLDAGFAEFGTLASAFQFGSTTVIAVTD